jgi:hypothetical protein
VVTERFFKQSQPSNVTCESTAKGERHLSLFLVLPLFFTSVNTNYDY